MLCSNCGAQNGADVKFCFSCGTAVNAGRASSPQVPINLVGDEPNGQVNNNIPNNVQIPPKVNKPNFIVMGIIAVAVLGVLIFLAITFLGNDDNNQTNNNGDNQNNINNNDTSNEAEEIDFFTWAREHYLDYSNEQVLTILEKIIDEIIANDGITRARVIELVGTNDYRMNAFEMVFNLNKNMFLYAGTFGSGDLERVISTRISAGNQFRDIPESLEADFPPNARQDLRNYIAENSENNNLTLEDFENILGRKGTVVSLNRVSDAYGVEKREFVYVWRSSTYFVQARVIENGRIHRWTEHIIR